MGLNATNYVLQIKGDKSIASGFDHAVRTGDNTFSIYFIDGSKVDLTIPLPKDGKDAISITGISDKGNGKFTLLFSDGSESDPIQSMQGLKGDKGDPGEKGDAFTYDDFTSEQLETLKGQDGFSPTAIVTKSGNKSTLTVTDKNGTTSVDILDGSGGTGGGIDLSDIEIIQGKL